MQSLVVTHLIVSVFFFFNFFFYKKKKKKKKKNNNNNNNNNLKAYNIQKIGSNSIFKNKNKKPHYLEIEEHVFTRSNQKEKNGGLSLSLGYALHCSQRFLLIESSLS
jgi:regulatory protein YycI of two-component signal transduction system YycFG